jgi:predicted transcriptional regulator
MWELLQKILKENITPDQLLLLYSIDERISVPQINPKSQIGFLVKEGYVDQHKKENKLSYTITKEGKSIIRKYNNYFIKAKKKTNIQLMGKDFAQKLEEYRNIFPAGRLPSGKPGRQNVRSLETAFRWFFENYEFTWDEIMKASRMYVNEFEDKQFLYMKNSQYFVSKQDKHKVKQSDLADYCDMIKDGVIDQPNHFKDRVV